ncbi:MAG: hypothetical protein ACXWT4_18925 [Methylobacter sp.]
MTHWPVFVEFAALALVIGGSGYFLSLYGDVIAEKTGLGGTWVGIALLATVTSLPELVTGISAVTYVNVPNIALGDALGSCVFNLLLIVLLDFCIGKLRFTPGSARDISFPPVLESCCSVSRHSISSCTNTVLI